MTPEPTLSVRGDEIETRNSAKLKKGMPVTYKMRANWLPVVNS